MLTKKHSLIHLLLALGLVCSAVVQGQKQYTILDDIPGVVKAEKPAFSSDYPDWAKLLYQEDLNVFVLDQGFQEFALTHPGAHSPIIRYYKNWRRAVEPYIQDDGSVKMPDLDLYRKQLHEAQIAGSKVIKSGSNDGSAWTFLGPKQTFWLNESGAPQAPESCPWQVNVYSFDVAASDNNTLYAGTETRYVNKSTDNGLSWKLVGQGYPFGGAITAVAIHPQNPEIVYVSGGNQIHKTIDGGQNWTPMLDSPFAAVRLVIDGVNPDKIVAATDKGVYLSLDGANSWARKWTRQSWDVEIKPDDPNVNYALAKNSTGKYEVLVSLDAGETFAADANFPTDITDVSGGLLAVTAANPNLLFAILLSSNDTPLLYKGIYAQGGFSWELKATGKTSGFAMNNWQGYFDLVLAVSPINENIIFTGTSSLYKSIDGGASFSLVGGYGGNFPVHPDIQDIKMLPNGKTWVSTDGGMTLSTDNFTSTSNFFARINGIVGSDMWGFDQGWNEDLFVGGRYHNGNTAVADFYGSKALRMGGAESPTGWVLQGKSRHVAFDDLGSGWILPKTATDAPEGRFIFSKFPNMEEYGGRRSNILTHPLYYGVLYVGEGRSIWKSTDMGESYVLLNTFADQVRWMQISYSNPEIIYADVLNRGLYKSEDGGISWTNKTSLTRSPYGNSNWKGKLFFAISPYDGNRIYACLQNGTWSADLGKVFKSEDGGDTWVNWSGGLSEYTKNLIVQPTASGEDLVYLLTNAINGRPGKVFYRKGNEESWSSFVNDYPAGMDVNLALPFYRDSKLRVAGNGGVWESPLQEPAFTPLITPWVERPHFNCMLDTLHFEDHSILNHEGASWSWSIDPAPAYISDTQIRNPSVVLGTPGSYTVTLTVTQNGQVYSRTVENMVTTTTCPSVGDCTNPAEIPKSSWRLLYVDSEERNYPGLGSMAIDGDPSTIWHTRWSTGGTSQYPHEFQVDMVERYSVHKFIYLPRQSGVNGRIKDWELYVGDDYMDYGDPVATGSWENSAGPKTVILPETKSGQYWKLVALSEVNDGPWASAAEFTVIGCNGDTSGSDLPDLDGQISAYPIPTDGLLYIDLQGLKNYQYQVLDLQGKKIKEGTIHNQSGSYILSLDGIDAGLYFIGLSREDGVVYWVKAVKE